MKTEHYTASGVRVLRGQNISDSGRIEGEFVYISEDFADSLGSARLRRDDIALPHRGAIGKAALVNDDDLIMSTSLMRVRVDNALADPRFVASFLSSAEGQREILQFASTVGTPGIGQPLSSLRQVKVPYPPLAEQQRIASVLGALDDLIETNRVLVSRLEAQVSARFARAGFDDEPAGEILQLSELVMVGPPLPKPAGDVPYIDMAALPTDSSRIEHVMRRPASGGARFQNGDTLLARLTPCLENGKAAFVDVLDGDDVGIGSTEFLVLRDRGTVGQHWPYVLTRSPRFRDYAVLHMNGSSGRQRVSADSISHYPVAPPNHAELSTFRTHAAVAFGAITSLSEEMSDLVRARDTLLPLMMSGQVHVSKDLAVA